MRFATRSSVLKPPDRPSSPTVSKPSRALRRTPSTGSRNLAPDGITVPFADGHVRRLPRLVSGPFRFKTYASSFLETARQFTQIPLKQAVISASLLSLLYPQEGIPGYPARTFLDDLVAEAVTDIRGCLNEGAFKVQIDFTEARLSLKLDPSGGLLQQFIGLNNRVLGQFSASERTQNRSAYLSRRRPGRNPQRRRGLCGPAAKPLQSQRRQFLHPARKREGPAARAQINPASTARRIKRSSWASSIPSILTSRLPQEVRDRVLEAAEFIPLERLGTTDDCGFSPFGDDTSTARETAFEKISCPSERNQACRSDARMLIENNADL